LVTQEESGCSIVRFGGLALREPTAKWFVLAVVIEASLPTLPEGEYAAIAARSLLLESSPRFDLQRSGICRAQ
jgi:hypothetical protein